eukprot:3864106-Prymnesium_polylepis.1
MQRVEYVYEIDHLSRARECGGGHVTRSNRAACVRLSPRGPRGRVRLQPKLIEIPVALLVFPEIKEAHAWRAVEGRSAASSAEGVDDLQLFCCDGEAHTAELALHPGQMTPAPCRLLAHSSKAGDDPLLLGVRELVEHRLVLPLVPKRLVALADARTVAVPAARFGVLRVA